MAIVLWWEHEKDSRPQTKGNNYVVQTARDAALVDSCLQTILELLAIPEPPLCFNEDTPMNSPKETELYPVY